MMYEGQNTYCTWVNHNHVLYFSRLSMTFHKLGLTPQLSRAGKLAFKIPRLSITFQDLYASWYSRVPFQENHLFKLDYNGSGYRTNGSFSAL